MHCWAPRFRRVAIGFLDSCRIPMMWLPAGDRISRARKLDFQSYSYSEGS